MARFDFTKAAVLEELEKRRAKSEDRAKDFRKSMAATPALAELYEAYAQEEEREEAFLRVVKSVYDFYAPESITSFTMEGVTPEQWNEIRAKALMLGGEIREE
jgi:hypothetical protein